MFTQDEVESLKDYQKCEYFHPYTCKDGHGELIPTKNGLYCSEPTCNYHQEWAHPFSINWSWKKQYQDQLNFIKSLKK